MYLFSRTATLGGDPRAALRWATEMQAHVNAHTENHPLSLWSAQFGYPVGAVSWSTMVESHADLQSAFAWITDDDDYFKLVSEGSQYVTTPMVDSLRQVVVGGMGEPPAVGACATVTTAVAANGKLAAAMAWGAEVSQHVASVTGLPSAFLADTYGSFGRLTWLGAAANMAAVDAAGAVMQSDTGYMERLSAIGDLFVPGSGHTGLLVRIA